MDTVSSFAPIRRADSAASSRLSWLVNFDGSMTHQTRSGPSASAATAALNAESMPPDRPRMTPGKPFLFT